jgi:hypothetical protein
MTHASSTLPFFFFFGKKGEISTNQCLASGKASPHPAVTHAAVSMEAAGGWHGLVTCLRLQLAQQVAPVSFIIYFTFWQERQIVCTNLPGHL